MIKFMELYDNNIRFRESLLFGTPSINQMYEINELINEREKCEIVEIVDEEEELITNFRNITGNNNDVCEIYIMYSNNIISDNTKEPLVLAVCILCFAKNNVFEDHDGNKYTTMFVDSRCSFVPVVIDKIKEVYPELDTPGTGNLLEYFIVDVAKKQAIRENVKNTIMLNYSVANDYHIRNGWNFYAFEETKDLKNNKKRSPIDEYRMINKVCKNDDVYEIHMQKYMYKVINV